jgi:hypothetical protein
MKLLAIVQILLLAAIIWIFTIYAQFHWWLPKLLREDGMLTPQLKSQFLSTLRNLHLAIIATSTLLMVFAGFSIRIFHENKK